MKKNLKEFWKEYEPEIIVGACVVGSALVGAAVGYQVCAWNGAVVRSNPTKKVLLDTIKKYPEGHCAFGGIHNSGLTAMELGKLGEKMVECGTPSDVPFTHFILYGPPRK